MHDTNGRPRMAPARHARRAALTLAALAAGVGAGAEPFDVVIENGRIVDGSGNPWFRADLGIRGARIEALGDLSTAEAARRIDAGGRVVCPGFIDMHSHASWRILVDGRAASKITQGVTLEIEGEGQSVAPLDDAMVERRRHGYQRFGVDPDWRSLDDFFQRLERDPPAINFATYIGTVNPREMLVGFDDRPATSEELEGMRRVVRAAMEDGALGIYSALMYSPDRYNRTEELIAMAQVAAEYGGVYQSHIRSESDAVDAALDEVFRISREAGLPGHVTHFKVTYKQNWGRMPEIVEKIDAARAGGLDVTADLYPYVRAGGSFTPLLPPWAQEGGAGGDRRAARRSRDAGAHQAGAVHSDRRVGKRVLRRRRRAGGLLDHRRARPRRAQGVRGADAGGGRRGRGEGPARPGARPHPRRRSGNDRPDHRRAGHAAGDAPAVGRFRQRRPERGA